MKELPLFLDTGRRSPRKHGLPAYLKSRTGSMGVPCPMCRYDRSVVIDSRVTKEGTTRRTRCCCRCQHRYTTFELYRPDHHPFLPRPIDFQI
jgi:hypothetical protein